MKHAGYSADDLQSESSKFPRNRSAALVRNQLHVKMA
jgi:hypothetical protein